MGDHSRVSDADRDRAASAAASVRSGQADRLERWYRRLLAVYPARYRGVHEEAMLAVLMTAAPEGRPWPGLAEAADLIVGAVRVWCQPSRGGTTVPTWRGAVALTSAGAVLGLLAGIAFAALNPPLLTSRTLVLVDRQNEPPLHPRALPKWFRHNPRPLGFSRPQAQALEYADAVGLTGLFAASGPVLQSLRVTLLGEANSAIASESIASLAGETNLGIGSL